MHLVSLFAIVTRRNDFINHNATVHVLSALLGKAIPMLARDKRQNQKILSLLTLQRTNPVLKGFNTRKNTT